MVGLLICVGQVSSMLFLRYGLPNFEADELFRIIAIVQLVLVSGLSFFLNEKPVRKRDRPKLSVKRYLNDLMAHPVRRKFAMLNFTLAMVLNLAITGGMLALFVKHNLGASQAEYGANWAWSSMVPLLFSVPVAIVIEKYISKRWALGGGFFVMVVALSIGWFAQTMYHFYLMALTWGVGFMLVQVTYKPFFTEYIPSDIIGQVSGALNICYGLGRALAILISGFAVDYLFNDNYRYMFPMAIVMGIVSIWISLSIRDLRYEDRKKARA